MSVRTWRLIESGFASGPWNMAVDEAIMRAVASGERPPTLRLYGWQPPALSLGYFQPLDDGIDLDECRRRGYDLIRRPTGGRAILHDDELTYSFCVRQDEIRGGHSVMRSYREISRGLVAGLQKLGAEVTLGDDGSHGPDRYPGARAICFAKTARCDLQAAGRKIVGSAQVRRDGAILQHGSIPLTINPAGHAAVMPGPAPGVAAEGLDRAAVSVTALLGRPVTFEELSRSVIEGFAEAFELHLRAEQLSPDEEACARRLCRDKYTTAAWNEERRGTADDRAG